MKKWAKVELNSGVCVNVVESEEKPTTDLERFDWIEIVTVGGPGFTYDFKTKLFSPIPEIKNTIISRLNLIEELKTSYPNILVASKSDVNIEVWLEKFRLQEIFALYEDNVKEQINFLVTKKLLSKAEADRILSL